MFGGVWAKLHELRLSRLTVAGWMLFAVTVALIIALCFAKSRRFSDVLTDQNDQRNNDNRHV